MVGSVVGNYQIIRKLGEGGMGAVYLAQHTLLGRRAALKMLLPMLSARPDVVNRFFNEARATTSISDPGIVQIFDFGYHTDGTAYIVMEFLEGETLDARLAKLGRLPVVDALRLTRQVATSLAAAHAQHIVHRDLKPENIFLVRDPEIAWGERPKILDFGIAKLSDDQPGKVKTSTGALMGTPLYMSPEQCRGASELDYRSDIYALGCVLFHLIAGAPPFDGEGLGDIIAMHLREPAPLLSSRAAGVAPNVDALVSRCLAKRPEDRFQSMQELAAAIGSVLPYPINPDAPTQIAPVTGTPPAWATPTPVLPISSHVSAATTLGSGTGQVIRTARSSRWVLPLVAVLVLGIGGLGTGLVLGRGGGSDAETTAPASGGAGVALPAPPSSAPGNESAAATATAAMAPAPVAPDAAPAPSPTGSADAAMTTTTSAPDAAVDTTTNHSKRPHKSGAGSAARGVFRPGSNSNCDRRVDLDCDGIPDVR